jgi:uncharacterized glyoxalase superfamily protein PhnB
MPGFSGSFRQLSASPLPLDAQGPAARQRDAWPLRLSIHATRRSMAAPEPVARDRGFAPTLAQRATAAIHFSRMRSRSWSTLGVSIEKQSKQETIAMKKLTPVLVVEHIEDCLPFWVDRFGFEQTMQVPDGDKLGFVGLRNENVEVMLQSRASVEQDIPAIAEEPFRSALFVEVDDLDAIVAAGEGLDIVVPRRQTFYGADEIAYRDPAGNIITFAKF